MTSPALRLAPPALRPLLVRHAELVRFVLVGGISFTITTVLDYALKLTVLQRSPVTALVLAVMVATAVSYVLSREWSFRDRDATHRRHREIALFVLISAVAIGLNALPLYVSRYVLDLQVPHVALLTQELADVVSGFVVGTVLGTTFRWWACTRWVFPARAR